MLPLLPRVHLQDILIVEMEHVKEEKHRHPAHRIVGGAGRAPVPAHPCVRILLRVRAQG